MSSHKSSSSQPPPQAMSARQTSSSSSSSRQQKMAQRPPRPSEESSSAPQPIPSAAAAAASSASAALSSSLPAARTASTPSSSSQTPSPLFPPVPASTSADLSHHWQTLIHALDDPEPASSGGDGSSGSSSDPSSEARKLERPKQLLVEVVRALSSAPLTEDSKRVVLFLRTLTEAEMESAEEVAGAQLDCHLPAVFPFLLVCFTIMARADTALPKHHFFAAELQNTLYTFCALLYRRTKEVRAMRCLLADVQELLQTLLPLHYAFTASVHNAADAFEANVSPYHTHHAERQANAGSDPSSASPPAEAFEPVTVAVWRRLRQYACCVNCRDIAQQEEKGQQQPQPQTDDQPGKESAVPPCTCTCSEDGTPCPCAAAAHRLSAPPSSLLSTHHLSKFFALNLHWHGHELSVTLLSPSQLHFYTEKVMQLYLWLLEHTGDLDAFTPISSRGMGGLPPISSSSSRALGSLRSMRLYQPILGYAALPDHTLRGLAFQLLPHLLTRYSIDEPQQPILLQFLQWSLEARADRGERRKEREEQEERDGHVLPNVRQRAQQSQKREDARFDLLLHHLLSHLPLSCLHSHALQLLEAACACMSHTLHLPLLHTLCSLAIGLFHSFPLQTLLRLDRFYPHAIQQLQRVHAAEGSQLFVPAQLTDFLPELAAQHLLPFVSLQCVWEERDFSPSSVLPLQVAFARQQAAEKEREQFQDMPGLERSEGGTGSARKGNTPKRKRAGRVQSPANASARKMQKQAEPKEGTEEQQKMEEEEKEEALLAHTLPALSTLSSAQHDLLSWLQPFFHHLLNQALPPAFSDSNPPLPLPSHSTPAQAVARLQALEQAARLVCSQVEEVAGSSPPSTSAAATSSPPSPSLLLVQQVHLWLEWLSTLCASFHAASVAGSAAAAPHAPFFSVLPTLLQSMFDIVQICGHQLQKHAGETWRAAVQKLCAWPARIQMEGSSQPQSQEASPLLLPFSCLLSSLCLLCSLPGPALSSDLDLFRMALEAEHAPTQCAALLLLPSLVVNLSKAEQKAHGKKLLQTMSRMAATATPVSGSAESAAPSHLAAAVAASIGPFLCSLDGAAATTASDAQPVLRLRHPSFLQPSARTINRGTDAYLKLQTKGDQRSELDSLAKQVLSPPAPSGLQSSPASQSQSQASAASAAPAGPPLVPFVQSLQRFLQPTLQPFHCARCDGQQACAARDSSAASASFALKDLLPFLPLLQLSQPLPVRKQMLHSFWRLLRHLPAKDFACRASQAAASSSTLAPPASPPSRKAAMASPPRSKGKQQGAVADDMPFSLSQMAVGSGKKPNPRMARTQQQQLQQQPNFSLSMDPASPARDGSGSQHMDVDEGEGSESPSSSAAPSLHPLALQLFLLLFDPAEEVRQAVVEQVELLIDADYKGGPFLMLFDQTDTSAQAADSAAASIPRAFEQLLLCLRHIQTNFHLLPAWPQQLQRSIQAAASSRERSMEGVGLGMPKVTSPLPAPSAVQQLLSGLDCFLPSFLLTTFSFLGQLSLLAPLASDTQRALLWALVDALSHATTCLQAEMGEPLDRRLQWKRLQQVVLSYFTRMAHEHSMNTSTFFFLHSHYLFKQIFRTQLLANTHLLPLLFQKIIAQDGDTAPSSLLAAHSSSAASDPSSSLTLAEFYQEGVRMLLPNMLLDDFSLFCEPGGAGAGVIQHLAKHSRIDNGSTRSLLIMLLDPILAHLFRRTEQYTHGFVQQQLLPYFSRIIGPNALHLHTYVGFVLSNILFDLVWRMGDETHRQHAMAILAWIMDNRKRTEKEMEARNSGKAQGRTNVPNPPPPLSPAAALQPFSVSAPTPTPVAVSEYFQTYFLGVFTKLHALLTASFESPVSGEPTEEVRVPQLFRIHGLHALATLLQISKNHLQGFIPKILATLVSLTSSTFRAHHFTLSALTSHCPPSPSSSPPSLPPFPYHLLCVWSVFIDTLVEAGHIGEYVSTIVITLAAYFQRITLWQEEEEKEEERKKGSGAVAGASSAASSPASGELLYPLSSFHSYRSSLPSPRIPQPGQSPDLYFTWLSALPEYLLEQTLVPDLQPAETAEKKTEEEAASSRPLFTAASFRSHCLAHILSILSDLLLSDKVKNLNLMLSGIPRLPCLPSLQPLQDRLEKQFEMEVDFRLKQGTKSSFLSGRSTPASNSRQREKEDASSTSSDSRARASFFLRLERILSTLSHDSGLVRLFTLRHLRDLLTQPSSRLHWEAFCSLELTEGEGASGNVSPPIPLRVHLPQLLSSLLQTCSDLRFDVRLLAAEVLGEIGAIDPAHLSASIRVKPPHSTQQHEQQHRTVQLAHFLIQNLLVKALRGAADSLAQDRALYAIQQLLKYCGIDTHIHFLAEANQKQILEHKQSRATFLDDQIRALLVGRPQAQFLPHSALTPAQQLIQAYQAMWLWLSFPTDVRAVITPCLSSAYVIEDPLLQPITPTQQTAWALQVDEKKGQAEAEDAGGKKGGTSARKRKEPGRTEETAMDVEQDTTADKRARGGRSTPERKKAAGGSAASTAPPSSSPPSSSAPLLTSATIHPLPSRPIFRPRHPLLTWLSSFTRHLIAYTALPNIPAQESSPAQAKANRSSSSSSAPPYLPETLVYQACIGVVQSDAPTALFLLPYLVDHALRYGGDALVEFIHREIMAVLNSHSRGEEKTDAQHSSHKQADGSHLLSAAFLSPASSSPHSSTQVVIQTIFDLLDTLQGWLLKARKQAEAERNQTTGVGVGAARPGQLQLSYISMPDSASLFPSFLGPSLPFPSCRSLDAYKQFLDSIPQKALAHAAFHCQAYTRALKYMEMHLREEKEKWRMENQKREALQQQTSRRGRATQTSLAAAASVHSDPSSSSDLITTGQGAGLLNSDLDSFQSMYSCLEEPDGMRGLAALRQKSSLHSEIKDMESRGAWAEALTHYEKCVQIYPQQTQLHTGMLECLRNLGQWKAGLTCAQALLAEESDHSSLSSADRQHVSLLALQNAWRLRDWSAVQQLLSGKDAPDLNHFEGRLAALLLALHQGDEEQYEHALVRARRSVLTPLAAASWESYERTYPYLLQLQLIQEVEQLRMAMSQAEEATTGKNGASSIDNRLLPGSPPTLACFFSGTEHPASSNLISPPLPLRDALSQLGTAWSARLRRSTQTFRIREHILSLRRVLYSEFHLNADAGSGWLHLAQEARESHQFEVASGALLHAAELGVPHTFLERAKLMRAKGGQWSHDALAYLEKESASLDARSKQGLLVGSQGTIDSLREGAVSKAMLANTNLLLGIWMQESSAKESRDVISLYTSAIHNQPKWEEAHFRLGQYFDDLLLAETNRARSSSSLPGSAQVEDSKGKGKSGVGGASHDVISKFLWAIMQSYGASLTYGHKFLFQSMPRMLTLWFEHTEHWHPSASSASTSASSQASASSVRSGASHRPSPANTLEEKFSRCHALMMELARTLGSFQWLTSFPQIISRLTHTNPRVYDFIKEVIVRVFKDYPQQAMWLLAAVTKSIDQERINRAREIVALVRKQVPQHTNQVLDRALSMFDQLIRVCNYLPRGRRLDIISLSKDFPQLRQMRDLPIIVPLQRALTVTLPPQSGEMTSHAAAGSALIEGASLPSSASSYDQNYQNVARTYRAFPSSQATIVSFADEIEVLRSKEKPKKLPILASDGQTYLFLCKKEVRGDMRKNSRMMEFNTVVNRLLKEQGDARARHLSMRTFSVLPLTEECGLIEWVPHTNGFRHIVRAGHDEEGIVTDFAMIRRMYDELPNPDDPTNYRALYHRLCDMYKPVFHKWFLTQFPEPSAWFEARLRFARSSAVWSMVGYVVGLGDRHGENILLDETSGECVHVDFDCLFGKGLTLEKPERVPFRLTPNMIDALGITGVEGLFACSAESALQVMRSNHQTMMSVLHTFIYDPLVEWKVNPPPNQGHPPGSVPASLAGGGGGGSSSFNPNALKILEEIDTRLRGVVAKESLPLSVPGQVAQLIKEATSIDNLARMYIGWMAWT